MIKAVSKKMFYDSKLENTGSPQKTWEIFHTL